MLKPFYMLEGNIEIAKEIKLDDGRIERHYADDRGNMAVVIMKDYEKK